MGANGVGVGGLVWAGAAAPAVWLGGAFVMSYSEERFMDRLGWDVWPSGLALGPHGWGQIVVFLVFAAVYVVFALHVREVARWSRPARTGGLVLLGGACLTPLLAFRTDPMGDDMTWHGGLHAAGYVALMVTMLLAFALLYPGLVRRSRPADWRWAPAALLLVVPAWLMPNATGTANYLFFAVPFTLLAALAVALAGSDGQARRMGRVATPEPSGAAQS